MTGSTVSIRLRAYRGEQHDTTECFNGLRDEAADLIDSLIAEHDRLRAELSKHQESEFHPDWSMLEATRESLREHQQMIRDLRAEVAASKELADGLQETVAKQLEQMMRDVDRAEKAEAEAGRLHVEIEQLRAALQSIAANTCCDRCQEAALVAKAALVDPRKEALE